MPGFDAEVRASGRGSHAVVVPKAVLVDLPSRRVVARIGDETFEATLGAYGGRTFLGLRKSLLTVLGVSAGDTVHVDLEPGTSVAQPDLETPPTTCPELGDALASDPALSAAWSALPETHRTEYGRWISAADPSTRIARLRHRLL